MKLKAIVGLFVVIICALLWGTDTQQDASATKDNQNNFVLAQVLPNPFNSEITISYQLDKAGDVKLEIYNMLGQVVATLVDKPQDAGKYSIIWKETKEDGQNLSSGIYFYALQVGDEFHDVKKILIL